MHRHAATFHAVIETTGDESPNVRLSCQIPVTEQLDGLVVRLPEAQT